MKKIKNDNKLAFPQQPTAEQFYARGFVPNSPVGFYMQGGATNEIAFPQQPDARHFFSGFPWTPRYEDGGGVPVVTPPPVYPLPLMPNPDMFEAPAPYVKPAPKVRTPVSIKFGELDPETNAKANWLREQAARESSLQGMAFGGQPCYECGGAYYEQGGYVPEGYHMMDNGMLMSDEEMEYYKNGGQWIQAANKKMKRKGTKGAFTDYCGGKVTDECIQRGLNSPDPTTRKRAAFAKSMRSIKRAKLGQEVPQGSDMSTYLDANKQNLIATLQNNNMDAMQNELEQELFSDAYPQMNMYNVGGYIPGAADMNPDNMMNMENQWKMNQYQNRADNVDTQLGNAMGNLYGATMNYFGNMYGKEGGALQSFQEEGQTGSASSLGYITPWSQDQFNQMFDRALDAYYGSRNPQTYAGGYYHQPMGMERYSPYGYGYNYAPTTNPWQTLVPYNRGMGPYYKTKINIKGSGKLNIPQTYPYRGPSSGLSTLERQPMSPFGPLSPEQQDALQGWEATTSRTPEYGALDRFLGAFRKVDPNTGEKKHTFAPRKVTTTTTWKRTPGAAGPGVAGSNAATSQDQKKYTTISGREKSSADYDLPVTIDYSAFPEEQPIYDTSWNTAEYLGRGWKLKEAKEQQKKQAEKELQKIQEAKRPNYSAVSEDDTNPGENYRSSLLPEKPDYSAVSEDDTNPGGMRYGGFLNPFLDEGQVDEAFFDFDQFEVTQTDKQKPTLPPAAAALVPAIGYGARAVIDKFTDTSANQAFGRQGADSNFYAAGQDMGNYLPDIYAGQHFRPNETMAKVDPWGMNYMGAQNRGQQIVGNRTYGRYGGDFAVGGEVEWTNEQIMQYLADGGTLQFLD